MRFGGGGRPNNDAFLGGMHLAGYALNIILFNGFFTFNLASEAQATIIATNGFTIRRIQCTVTENSKDDDTIIGFRDDGVTVASITIPTLGVGVFDTGVIDIPVTAGSLINMIIDTTASGLGTIAIGSYVIDVRFN